MIQYFIIIFLLFIFIYLIKNNCFSTIENIEDNVSTSNTETWIANETTLSGTEPEINTLLNKYDDSTNEVTKAFEKGVYLTDNKINYDLLDHTFETLQRQYNAIKFNIDNIKISDVKISTQQDPKFIPDSSNCICYGSFPNEIIFDLKLPSPLPGLTGEKGEKGEPGPKGPSGKQGPKGHTGPFGYCPTKTNINIESIISK